MEGKRAAAVGGVYPLGQEPGSNLSASTSAEERLAMMWPLAVEAWTLTGRALPDYTRSATPIRLRPLSRADPTA